MTLPSSMPAPVGDRSLFWRLEIPVSCLAHLAQERLPLASVFQVALFSFSHQEWRQERIRDLFGQRTSELAQPLSGTFLCPFRESFLGWLLRQVRYHPLNEAKLPGVQAWVHSPETPAQQEVVILPLQGAVPQAHSLEA